MSLIEEFYRDDQLVQLLDSSNESNKLDFIGLNQDDDLLFVDSYRRVALDFIKNSYSYDLKNRELKLLAMQYVFPFKSNSELEGKYTEIIKG